MTACYYLNSSGLNDTISFQTDSGSKHIIGMQVEVKDIAHLVSIEKSAKKKRLLKTRQFKVHAGSAVLSKMIEGSQPQLEKENYDAQGNEKQVRKKRTVVKPATTPDGEATTVEVDAAEPEQE